METIQAHDLRKPVYKKPLFWIILAMILIVIAVAVCLLTKPKCRATVPEASSIPVGEVMQWLDYYIEMPREETKEIAVDAFPNVMFRWTYGSVEAVEDGATRTLFSGMPVWNVFFTDLTGDGKPELCATVSFGSGMIDDHIVVYDYENRQSYTLWERGAYDYHLYTENGALLVGKTLCNSYSSDTSILDTGTLTMQDGLLCCRWSDGSVTVLNRELHESELYGEWLVEEDANDPRTSDARIEYDFREDGTVVFRQTPLYASYEFAFGYPVDYRYAVYVNYVHIEDGCSCTGYYDAQTQTLKLNYQPSPGQYVYATLRRISDSTQDDTMLDEATLCTIWMLAEVEAPDGSNGDARGLGLERYLVFRSDGTVRMIDVKAPSDRVVPYTLNGNTVRFDSRVLRYDSEYNELIEIDPSTQDVLFYTPAPNAVLPAETDANALTQEQADAFVNGLSVEFEDGSPYGCDLVVFIDGFGRCLNAGDADAWKTASLRFVPGDYEATDAIYAHVGYAKLLTVGDREYYLGSIRVFSHDGQLNYHHHIWDDTYPAADTSIFVYAEPSMMERNREVPERACVIKAIDAENRTVTVSYVSFGEPEDGYPAYILYDTVEDETFTFSVTDDTMLILIDDYTALVKPDLFFRYLEQNGYMYLDRPDSDDRGIGFWIGLDGDTLLYLCEVYEE